MTTKAPYSYQKNRFRYIMALSAAQEWRCHYCAVEMECPGIGNKTARTATIDHKLAVVKGGSYELDNLVACCSRCNSRKNKHKSHDEFFALMTVERIMNGGAK